MTKSRRFVIILLLFVFGLALAPSLFPYPNSRFDSERALSWRFIDRNGTLLREVVGEPEGKKGTRKTCLAASMKSWNEPGCGLIHSTWLVMPAISG